MLSIPPVLSHWIFPTPTISPVLLFSHFITEASDTTGSNITPHRAGVAWIPTRLQFPQCLRTCSWEERMDDPRSPLGISVKTVPGLRAREGQGESVFHGLQPYNFASWEAAWSVGTRLWASVWRRPPSSWRQLAQRGEERKEDQAAEAPAAWWQASLLRAQGQCQATWWPRYVDLCLPPLVSGTYCPMRTIDQESAGRDSDRHGHHLHKYYLQLSLLISQNLGCLSSKMRLLGQILPS